MARYGGGVGLDKLRLQLGGTLSASMIYSIALHVPPSSECNLSVGVPIRSE